MVNSEKQKYSSPDLDIVDICNTDVIATSGPQGGGDGNGDGTDIDYSGWT